MDYGSIVERSFRLAWRYKSLWILGLFSGYGTANFSYNDHRLNFANQAGTTDPSVIFSEMAPFFMVLIWLGLLLLAAYCIAKPALIDAVNRIARGGVYRFADSFSAGVSMFFRFLGLSIISMLLVVAVIFVLVFFYAMMFMLNVALGIILLLPGIPLAIAFMWAFLSVFQLAERAIVVRDSTIADALGEGWVLFRNHLKETAVIALIIVGLGIGLAIVAGIIMLIFGAPIALAVVAMNLPLLPALIAGFVMALPVAIIIGGIMGTAMTALYTLFYFELVEPGGAHTDMHPETTPTV